MTDARAVELSIVAAKRLLVTMARLEAEGVPQALIANALALVLVDMCKNQTHELATAIGLVKCNIWYDAELLLKAIRGAGKRCEGEGR